MNQTIRQVRRRVILLSIVILACLLGFLALRNWSAIGSKLANPMRKVFGVERVAQMETILFDVQDRINKWKYALGLSQPEAPWGVADAPTPTTRAPTPIPGIGDSSPG